MVVFVIPFELIGLLYLIGVVFLGGTIEAIVPNILGTFDFLWWVHIVFTVLAVIGAWIEDKYSVTKVVINILRTPFVLGVGWCYIKFTEFAKSSISNSFDQFKGALDIFGTLNICGEIFIIFVIFCAILMLMTVLSTAGKDWV